MLPTICATSCGHLRRLLSPHHCRNYRNLAKECCRAARTQGSQCHCRRPWLHRVEHLYALFVRGTVPVRGTAMTNTIETDSRRCSFVPQCRFLLTTALSPTLVPYHEWCQEAPTHAVAVRHRSISKRCCAGRAKRSIVKSLDESCQRCK